MLESGEVNGKQIDKDVILDVKEEDSKILINAKKAEIVSEDSDSGNKQDQTKKADIPSERKAAVITDKDVNDKNSKSEDKTKSDDESTAKSKQSDDKKGLLDKHVEKEKDKPAEEATAPAETKVADESTAKDKPAC